MTGKERVCVGLVVGRVSRAGGLQVSGGEGCWATIYVCAGTPGPRRASRPAAQSDPPRRLTPLTAEHRPPPVITVCTGSTSSRSPLSPRGRERESGRERAGRASRQGIVRVWPGSQSVLRSVL